MIDDCERKVPPLGCPTRSKGGQNPPVAGVRPPAPKGSGSSCCHDVPFLLVRCARGSTTETKEAVMQSLLSSGLGERFKVVVFDHGIDAWIVSPDGIVQELKGSP